MNAIKIRAHHVLCCASFQGKGYSKGFIDVMKKIQEAILAGAEIRPVPQADMICDSCPNIESPNCATVNSLVSRMDRKVLSLLNNYNSDKYAPALEYYEKLAVAGEGALNAICPQCEWKINKICKISIRKIEQFMERIAANATDS